MKTRSLLILLVVSVSLISCLRTRRDIEALESDKTIRNQVVTLQQSRADLQVRLQEVDTQFRDLRGRIEVVENEMQQLKGSAENDEAKKLQERKIDERFKLYQEALEGLEKQVVELKVQLQAMEKKSKSVAKKPTKSLFGLAEEQFDKKNWMQAIVMYQKYRDRFPKGKSYALATYKIGVCFQELNKKSEAKVFYDEVVERFPKSREAKKAQYRLSRLNKSAS